MRKTLMIGTALAVLVTTPALAQGRGGPPAGVPGGGPGGGMGAGPPMTPPGQMGLGAGTADYARGTIANQRGQFGRDLANQQRLTPEERRQRAEQFRVMGMQHRQQALELAAAVRAGAPLPPHAAERIRQALENDLQLWREEFEVGRREWQAMRDRWLADRSSLSPQEWALRRADWFAARDAWIQAQRDWAQSQGQ